MSDFGAIVQNPVPIKDEARCFRCHDEALPKVADGKASCRKCGTMYGFMKIKGEVRYGVCL